MKSGVFLVAFCARLKTYGALFGDKNHKAFSRFCLCGHEKSGLESAEISPLFGSLKGLPPIFIQVGSDEILLSDSLRLANLARISGVDVQVKVWRGMWHVWQSFGNWMPESRDAIAEVGYIIQKNLSK